jgi:hypothetical protein
MFQVLHEGAIKDYNSARDQIETLGLAYKWFRGF